MTAPIVNATTRELNYRERWNETPVEGDRHLVAGGTRGTRNLGQLWEREAERNDRAEMTRIDAAFTRIDAEMTHYEGELTRVQGELDALFTDLDRAMQAATRPFIPADTTLPEGWPPAPHVHEHRVVADFGGIRACIAECACGDTRTFWRSALFGEVIG